MIKVEKNIPIPPQRSAGGRPPKYPWLDLEVGDSFLVEGIESSSKFSGRFQKIAKKYGIKFTVRKVEQGVRVWRVE